MELERRLFFLACVAAQLFLCCCAGQGGAVGELVISDARGNVLFQTAMKPGSSFAISYTHSVALSPVMDVFKIVNNKIILDKTIYKDFGAGLPPCPEGAQKMSFDNGRLVISGYDREFSSFDLRVGRVAGHALLLWPGGERDAVLEIPLATLARPGSAITFHMLERAEPSLD